MLITISFKGRKLFKWRGCAADRAHIDNKMMQLAKSSNTTRQAMWRSVVKHIDQFGGLFTPNPQAELMMMVLLWGVLQSKQPIDWDRDFDFDIVPCRL